MSPSNTNFLRAGVCCVHQLILSRKLDIKTFSLLRKGCQQSLNCPHQRENQESFSFYPFALKTSRTHTESFTSLQGKTQEQSFSKFFHYRSCKETFHIYFFCNWSSHPITFNTENWVFVYVVPVCLWFIHKNICFALQELFFASWWRYRPS